MRISDWSSDVCSSDLLAELLLRANPHIRRALRATYPFVFVDEFQDTTYAQYDFLLSAFADGQTTVTAVGDDKQRIMAWADRKSVVEGKSVSVRVDLGGRRIVKKKK